MARCAHSDCRRWRPGFLVRAAGLGLRLDDQWYCCAPCLSLAVRQRLARTAPIAAPVMPTATQPRLGGVLATQKRIAPSLVEQAASVQARTGLRIGTQLVELGVVTRLDVLRALAAQSGVGFLTALDPGRLTGAPGDLSPAVVRALGVVPFEADRRHDVLKVACTAPVPRGSLAALRELTGSIIEPYLVADDHWPAVLQAYGAGRRTGAAAPTLVTDLEALAARVAETARQAGSVRMSEARCHDKLWVRLDAGGHVQELLVSVGAPVAASTVAQAAEPVRTQAQPRRVRAPRATGPRPRRPRAAPVPVDAPAARAVPAFLDAPSRLEAPPARPAATRARPVTADAGVAVGAPALAPVLTAVASPEPLAPVAVEALVAALPAPQAEPAPVDDGLDLSFLEVWDSRAVPLFEQ